MSFIYQNFIFIPLYNGFVFLMDVLPWADAGLAVIIFTVLIKFLLFPLSKKSIVTQIQMKKAEPEIKEIREKYKKDSQKQAIETMALYKKYNINPFSSIFLLIIQLPILIGLYSIFYRSGLPEINIESLYSFVKAPSVDIFFLGMIDISKPNIIMAFLAAISQFVQIKIAIPTMPKKDKNSSTSPSFQEELTRSMNTNMKYVFPVIVFVISYKLAAALALYWLVSNLFMIGQELFVKRRLEAKYIPSKTS